MNIRACFARALFALAIIWAVPASAQEVEVSEGAKQHFKTGVAYLTDPDGAQYEEAYREFKAAYADSPSWKILGNLGISAMKLERDGEAIPAFETYLEQGGESVDSAERAQMERDLQVLRASVVYVTLESTPSGARIVDERIPLSGGPVVNRYQGTADPLRLGIRRGRHRITARMAGYEDNVWEFDAEPGQELTYHFELKAIAAGAPSVAPVAAEHPSSQAAPPQTARPIPLPVYITAGATGALLIGGVVTGVLASGKHSDFEERNDGTNPAAAQDLKDSGETLNLVADILFVGAIAGGVTTAVLYFLRPEVPVNKDSAALKVNPSVGTRGGGLWVSARF